MLNAETKEMKQFAMDLEFLIRQKPRWKTTLQDVLFEEVDIVRSGETAEERVDQTPPKKA